MIVEVTERFSGQEKKISQSIKCNFSAVSSVLPGLLVENLANSNNPSIFFFSLYFLLPFLFSDKEFWLGFDFLQCPCCLSTNLVLAYQGIRFCA
jgi:hypothetical protein